jgi:hypothetical protein
MQFYALVRPPLDDWTHYTVAYSMEPDVVGEAQRCPSCNLLVGSLPWLPPYHAEVIARGGKFADVALCVGDSLLVSERFRDVWLDAQLSGIDVFSPVERIRARPARLKKKVPPYFHIAPRLFDVQIDLDHSLVEYTPYTVCAKCKGGDTATVRGFSLDETTWHGEDIFRAWGISGVTIVSDRVRELRDKHGLTNVNLTPIEDYLWDPEKRWTPYCYYLPDGFTPKAEHEYEYEYVTEEDPPTN